MTSNRTSQVVDKFLAAGDGLHKLDGIFEKYKRMESAITEVLNDSESKDGGWGPDVTMRAVLKEALDFDPLAQ